jgi:hypothetical protein
LSPPACAMLGGTTFGTLLRVGGLPYFRGIRDEAAE